MKEIEINEEFIKKFAEKLVNTEEVKAVINELKQQVRKETAKEILQDLYDQANNIWEAIEWTTEDIKQYAQKYGVEVDE